MSIFAIVSAVVQEAHDAGVEVADDPTASGLPQLDPAWWPSQIFWLAVIFGVLYWLMAAKFLPAIGGAIEERRDRIADDLDQAGEFKRQAEEAEKSYNQSLADAKAKAQAIAADTRAEMGEEIAKMQSETDATLEQDIAAAETRIDDMKAAAAAKVREAATDTARAIVETLIDEAPTKEAVDKAIARVSQA